MAEGDIFEDKEGTQFVQDATGEFVRMAKESPNVIKSAIFGGASAVMDNVLITAGVLDIVGGALDIAGIDETATSLFAASDEVRRIRERIQPESFSEAEITDPTAFAGGEIVGSFLPGGPKTQGLLGTTLGVGLGDTPGQKALGASAGLLGFFGARSAGRNAQRRALNEMLASASESKRARAEAIETLESLGIGDVLTEGDRAIPGTSSARFANQRDRLRQLLSPDDAIDAKRKALNGVVSDTIAPGQSVDAFTNSWRTKQQDKLDLMYDDIRDALPDQIPITDEADVAGLRMIEIVEDLRLDQRASVGDRVSTIINQYGDGKLTPARWSDFRSTLASDARSAAAQGEHATAASLYDIRTQFDEMVGAGEEAISKQLDDAGELFRYLEVLDSPGVIGQQLDLNPTTFLASMKRMFPKIWRQGSRNPQAAGVMYTAVQAAQQFPAFRTSGTGEMLTAGSILKQAEAAARLSAGTARQAVAGSSARALASQIIDSTSEGLTTTGEALARIPQQVLESLGVEFDQPLDE